MRLHRFFIKKDINTANVDHYVDIEMVHQLWRVFRLHDGDKVIFFNGSGTEYVCEIVSLDKDSVSFRVLETRIVHKYSSRNVTLAVSLIKKDHFEWIIQKATELGVSEFIPLVSERSEKKGFNMERAKKIMIEACEQSGRADVPTIARPILLSDFLATENKPIITFHTEGISFSAKSFSNTKAWQSIVACVGPEGGWSPAEIQSFKEKGASIMKLDTPVLRAETAAVSIATLLLLL